ncbi:MAG: HEAT repeat domain-containing protein [Planctomycetota bacterium]|nr:HEAT repeat domain-containing protein [Planctomycetota bacterium]
MVPLVVTPALIVAVFVGISVLFGGLAGDVASPAENLDRMLHGTSNERDQASLVLVQQVFDHIMARQEGRESEWKIDDSFLPDLRRTWEETAEEDVLRRYVLAVILVQLGDDTGVARLGFILDLSEDLDPGGELRFGVLLCLGALGPDLHVEQREQAAQRAIPFLRNEDAGLRSAAAIALQTLPTPETVPALQAALIDGSLAVRGNAAISLSHLGDGAGVDVLHDLLDPATYAAERGLDPALWTRAEDVSRSRVKAVEALARLGRPEDLERLREIAAGDPDLNVREAALHALERSSG